MVDMILVESSNVLEIGYSTEAGELHVRYRSSPSLYVYQGVPEEIYERLMSSSSKGTFINAEIKNVYQFYRG